MITNSPLTDDWRLEHVKLGDQAMTNVYGALADMDHHPDDPDDPQDAIAAAALINLMIGLAQAHYQAANVRAKPQTSVQIHGHDWPVK